MPQPPRRPCLSRTAEAAQFPASMTHATYSAEERTKHGFTDGLIRLSVGLEDYEVIRADLMGALDQLAPS